MSATGYRTIAINGCDVRREELANAALTPGHLLAYSSGKVVKHATEDGVALRKFFALEDPFAETTSGQANIDIAYAQNDTVYIAECKPGDVVYAWIADGVNAVEGVTPLVSKGDGTLKSTTVAATTLEGAVVAVPYESVDNSSGGAAARCAVVII